MGMTVDFHASTPGEYGVEANEIKGSGFAVSVLPSDLPSARGVNLYFASRDQAAIFLRTALCEVEGNADASDRTLAVPPCLAG